MCGIFKYFELRYNTYYIDFIKKKLLFTLPCCVAVNVGLLYNSLRISDPIMKNLAIQPLEIYQLQQQVSELPNFGTVEILANGFAYLDIDDAFIHQIYPLVNNQQATKPDYFDEKAHFIGAHISITYPEEGIRIPATEVGKLIPFKIEGLFTANILAKKYYALKVNAPELLELRLKYGLSKRLLLHGFWVDLHITVAVQGLDDYDWV